MKQFFKNHGLEILALTIILCCIALCLRGQILYEAPSRADLIELLIKFDECRDLDFKAINPTGKPVIGRDGKVVVVTKEEYDEIFVCSAELEHLKWQKHFEYFITLEKFKLESKEKEKGEEE